MPLIGSSNASIDLSPDGTMAKASVQVTDQTLQTILSMLPVKEIITASLKATETPRRAGPALSVETDAMVYTLKRVWPEPTFGETPTSSCFALPENAPPLTMSDAEAGTCGTQLISVVSASQPPKPDAKPAYSFSGQVTPPDK